MISFLSKELAYKFFLCVSPALRLIKHKHAASHLVAEGDPIILLLPYKT